MAKSLDAPNSNVDAIPEASVTDEPELVSSSPPATTTAHAADPPFPFADFQGNWKSLPDVLYFSSGKDSSVSWLSNFHHAKITLGGKEYHHVEGWFQACKFMEVDGVLRDSEMLDSTAEGDSLGDSSKVVDGVVEEGGISEGDVKPKATSKSTAEDRAYAERIRLEKNPRSVKALGRRRKMNAGALKRWEHGKKMDVMLAGLRAKFGSNGSVENELRQRLLATGQRPLAEQVRGDKTWGIGTKGDGKNLLGMCLMRVREEIRRDEESRK